MSQEICLRWWHLVLLLVSVFVVAALMPVAVSAASQRFSGVPLSDWAFDDVDWLADVGLTRGCGGGATSVQMIR